MIGESRCQQDGILYLFCNSTPAISCSSMRSNRNQTQDERKNLQIIKSTSRGC